MGIAAGRLRGGVEAATAVLTARKLARIGAGNRLEARSAVLDVSFHGHGDGNVVIAGPGAVLRGVRITIRGNKNVLKIGAGVRMVGGDLWLEGAGCGIDIGSRTSFEPGVKLAAVEDGRQIVVGEDCMFSEDVQVRTSDSHPIYDVHGTRINPGADITLADRVWVGNQAFLLKGATVASDTVIGARSVVSHPSTEPNVILAGAPAKVTRQGITWNR